jgi:hypothetical protein
MTCYTKTSAAIVLAWGLTAASLAMAEEAAGAPGEPPAGDESCWEKPGPRPHGERGRFIEKRLETLHTELKLSPSQEPAWNAWSGQVKAHIKEAKEHRPDWRALESLPAPERMEKMLAQGKERLSKLEEGLAAMKTFYAALSPEQRQILDKQSNFFRPGGGLRGKHGPE